MQKSAVISRLHTISTPHFLHTMLRQCRQTRAEALLLSTPPDADSAALLRECGLPLYKMGDEAQSWDLPLQPLGVVAATPDTAGWAPEAALGDLEPWLEAGHQHLIAPAAVVPVIRSLLNIWPLDPHLTRHYLRDITPLLREASEADYLAVIQARANPEAPRPAWAEAYLKQERRLFRGYLDH